MDWLSWQDVLEDEIDAAVEENRPLPSDEELLRKAGLPTSLEDVAEGVPQLKALLERRRALEDQMAGLLGQQEKRSSDARFDRLFNAPIPEDPVRPTRRASPLSLEARPLRERQREDQEDRTRRERLQESALARRAATVDVGQAAALARETRLEERLRERAKGRIPLDNIQRESQRQSQRQPQRAGQRETRREQTHAGKASEAPERLFSVDNAERAAGMTLDLLDQRKKKGRLVSTMDMALDNRKKRQERDPFAERPVLTQIFDGPSDGKPRLLMRSLDALSGASLDRRADDAAKRQRDRLEEIRKAAEQRRKHADDIRKRAEKKHDDADAVGDKAERRREKVKEFVTDSKRRTKTLDTIRDAARLARDARKLRKK